MGAGFRLDFVESYPSVYRESNRNSSAVQRVTSPTEISSQMIRDHSQKYVLAIWDPIPGILASHSGTEIRGGTFTFWPQFHLPMPMDLEQTRIKWHYLFLIFYIFPFCEWCLLEWVLFVLRWHGVLNTSSSEMIISLELFPPHHSNQSAPRQIGLFRVAGTSSRWGNNGTGEMPEFYLELLISLNSS